MKPNLSSAMRSFACGLCEILCGWLKEWNLRTGYLAFSQPRAVPDTILKSG
jgi:hypothetical protein